MSVVVYDEFLLSRFFLTDKSTTQTLVLYYVKYSSLHSKNQWAQFQTRSHQSRVIWYWKQKKIGNIGYLLLMLAFWIHRNPCHRSYTNTSGTWSILTYLGIAGVYKILEQILKLSIYLDLIWQCVFHWCNSNVRYTSLDVSYQWRRH